MKLARVSYLFILIVGLLLGMQSALAEMDEHHSLDSSQADFIAVKSGEWTDSTIWKPAKVPAKGAFVYIPSEVSVRISKELVQPIDFLLVDGSLNFSTTENTKLTLHTLKLTESASLNIGTQSEFVQKGVVSEIVFLGLGGDYQEETGLSGGLISQGLVEIHGEPKKSYATPINDLRKGTRQLLFSQDTNWQVGDKLVFPGIELGDADELNTIKEIENNGRVVVLESGLKLGHVLPKSIPKRVPVGNMTRNIRFSTHESVPDEYRAHIMFMQRQSGVNISHASFARLGRTDGDRTHTRIATDEHGVLMPEVNDNTIGMYAIHFHIQSGSNRKNAPHRIAHSVVNDCLKHGVVNHGGHVVASYNVTYQCAGSHFFAENGSEIGSFDNNLAIRSRGSGDKFLAREANADFGHGGHGFWLQGGGGVDVSDNYAFGHADAAYFYFGQYILEHGSPVYFNKVNAPNLLVFDEQAPLRARDIPINFSANVAVASTRGLDIWNNKEHAIHDIPSVVSDSYFYANELTSIFVPYSKNIVLQNIVAIASNSFKGIGINTNTKTSGLIINDSRIEGFAIGLKMPRHGATQIDGLTLKNATNISVSSPLSRDRVIDIKNLNLVKMPDWSNLAKLNYDQIIDELKYLKRPQLDFKMLGVKPTQRGDLSMVFEPTKLVIESGDNQYVGRQIYFSEQAPGVKPFSNVGVPELDAKSNSTLWDEFKLAVGGTMLPQDAKTHKRIQGYVGPIAAYLEKVPDSEFAIVPDVYNGNYLVEPKDSKLTEGWKFNTVVVAGVERTVMQYVDKTPPYLELDKRVPLEIHPDDVQFGLRLQGDVIDYVAGIKTINPVNREYRELEIDDQGYINVEYPITDAAGHLNNIKYAIKVSENAERRGQDLASYLN